MNSNERIFLGNVFIMGLDCYILLMTVELSINLVKLTKKKLVIKKNLATLTKSHTYFFRIVQSPHSKY